MRTGLGPGPELPGLSLSWPCPVPRGLGSPHAPTVHVVRRGPETRSPQKAALPGASLWPRPPSVCSLALAMKSESGGIPTFLGAVSASGSFDRAHRPRLAGRHRPEEGRVRGGRIWVRGEPVAAAWASASLSSRSAPHDSSGVLTGPPTSLHQNTSNSLPLRCDPLTDSTCV